MLGTRALSSKATSILKRDIDVLPWPEKEGEKRLSWWEKCLCDDVVKYTADFVRLRGRIHASSKSKSLQNSSQVFSEVFVRALGSVYANLQPSGSGLLDGLAYQAFCFGPNSNLDWPGDWGGQLREIMYRDHGDALRTVRILRFYEGNTIIMVKPDRLRYWIPSTAIRDADETLLDLQGQGY